MLKAVLSLVAPVKIDDYRLTKVCASGKVKLAVHAKTKELAVVKILKKTNRSEAQIMMLLRHPHIVQFKTLINKNFKSYIVMECVEGFSLAYFITNVGAFTEKQARCFARQVASALDYLHRNSIIHRDVKPSNIIMDRACANIKLIGFGLASWFSADRQFNVACGTREYMAVEVSCRTPYYGPEIDVWGFGVLLYVMITRSPPMLYSLREEVLTEMIQRTQDFYHLSDSFVDLLRKIFVIEHSARISLAKITRHEWLNEGYEICVQTHLSIRYPITIYYRSILQFLAQDFGIDTIGNIQGRLEKIVSDPKYRQDAMSVAEAYYSSNEVTPAQIKESPFVDPQSLPGAYHPLVSLYHLASEYLANQKEKEFVNKRSRVRSFVATMAKLRRIRK